MPLPADVSTFTLTGGPYTDATGFGVLAGTTGTLVPVDANGRGAQISHAGDGSVILPESITVTIAADGTWSVVGLAHTDDPNLTPSGFLYRLTWNVPAYRSSLVSKTFAVPVASGSTVDYDLLAPTTTTTGVSVNLPSVVSVGGQTGAVTSAQIATALDTDGTRLSDASLRAAYVAQALGAVSRITVLGHSYAMGDKNTRTGGWLGNGNLTAGSTAIASPTTSTGTAVVGQAISGPGVPDGATITAVTSGAPTAMSLPASVTRSPANLSAGAVREVRWPGRVAAALRAKERNYARNGSLAWQQGTDQGGFATAIQELTTQIQGAPYLPAHQVVAIVTGINDLGTYDVPARLSHAIRTMVSRARAAAIFEESHSSVVFGGGTWTTVSGSPYNSGGSSKYSPLNPTTATITITMPSDFPAGAVASFVFALGGDNQTYRTDGVYQFAKGATVLASLDTRNLMGTTSNVMEVCQRIAGLAAGDVVTVTFPTAPAGNVFFDCWMIEAPTAPLVLLLKQPLLTSTGYSVYTTAPVTDARVQAFNGSLDTLAAEFTDGMVKTVDLSFLDKNTAKMASDQLHPNEQGHADIASAVLDAIIGSPITRAGMLAGAAQRGY